MMISAQIDLKKHVVNIPAGEDKTPPIQVGEHYAVTALVVDSTHLVGDRLCFTVSLKKDETYVPVYYEGDEVALNLRPNQPQHIELNPKWLKSLHWLRVRSNHMQGSDPCSVMVLTRPYVAG